METGTLPRLKRVAGKKTVKLTHYGRKTGKPYQVTIWFVSHGDVIYIGTANVNRQWVRNVQTTSKVKVSIGAETFDGSARFLTDRVEHRRAQSLIARKYWMFSPLLAAGRILTSLGLVRDKTGFFEVTLAG